MLPGEGHKITEGDRPWHFIRVKLSWSHSRHASTKKLLLSRKIQTKVYPGPGCMCQLTKNTEKGGVMLLLHEIWLLFLYIYSPSL